MSNILDNNPPEGEPSEDPFPLLQTEISVDAKLTFPIDQPLLRQAACRAAAHRGFDRGQIGIRVTGDGEIQQINRRHLGHDYPTDVISFGYAAKRPDVDGELVVSVDTAVAQAAVIGWSAAAELALYVVHGTLHITGMDDHQLADRSAMRDAEKVVMTELGFEDIDRCGADVDHQVASLRGGRA